MENAVKEDGSIVLLLRDPSAQIINDAYEDETRTPGSFFTRRPWLMESGYKE
jgi:hypothetical protein